MCSYHIKIVFCLLSLCFFNDFTTAQQLTQEEVEANIKFYLFTTDSSQRVESTFDVDPTTQGCDSNGPFSIVVHGWSEGIDTFWVEPLIKKLINHRGGCIIFMDYNYYADVSNYYVLVEKFEPIAATLLKKVQQIGSYDKQFLFGFSFGARLVIDAGLKVGNQLIDRIDVCDVAGPGFDNNVDPTPAAKNVQCVHTSNGYGTSIYNCHQNFRMGYLGHSQPGAGARPLGSHGLCPVMYNLAFDFKYVPFNFHSYTSPRLAPLTPGVRMGYLGDFDRSHVRGDIFIMTARYPPYIMSDSIPLDNRFQNMEYFLNSQCEEM